MIAKRLSVLVLIAWGLSVNTLQAAGNVGLDDIISYRQYSDALSSSGQPTKRQIRALKDAGFERIVFLAFSDHDESIADEDRVVKNLNMEYVQIPIEWEAPGKSDFYLFAGGMKQAPKKKTLVHCEVNFRASAFSFLYRVLYENVPMDQAKDDMESVWVPNDTWRKLIFSILEENGHSPDCDACLWDTDQG